MSKERLSKLQKWILTTAHKDGRNSIKKETIYWEFFGHRQYSRFYSYNGEAIEEWRKRGNVRRVVLCRSLKTLEQRGLIKFEYSSYWIKLTKEGKKKALMLISENFPKLTIRKHKDRLDHPVYSMTYDELQDAKEDLRNKKGE